MCGAVGTLWLVRIWPAILLIYLGAGNPDWRGPCCSRLFHRRHSLRLLAVFFVFVIGHFSRRPEKRWRPRWANAPEGRWDFCRELYYLLPNFANYNAITAAAHGQGGGRAPPIAVGAVYGLVYGSGIVGRDHLNF